MIDLIVSKDELVKLFIKEDIKDSNNGWIYKDSICIDIIALHEKDPKFIYDVTDAQHYRLLSIEK